MTQPPQPEADWLDEILHKFRVNAVAWDAYRGLKHYQAKQAIIEGFRERLPKIYTYQDVVDGHKFEAWKEVRHLPEDDDKRGLVEYALGEGYHQALIEVNLLLNELGGKL